MSGSAPASVTVFEICVPSIFTITTSSMPDGAIELFGSIPFDTSYQVPSKLSTRSSPSVSMSNGLIASSLVRLLEAMPQACPMSWPIRGHPSTPLYSWMLIRPSPSASANASLFVGLTPAPAAK